MDDYLKNESLLEINNNKVGYQLYLRREIAEKTPLEVADELGMELDEYLDYEKGKRIFSVELIQKVANLYKVEPLSLLSSSHTNHFEHVYSSPINSNFHTYKSTNEKQDEAILTLIENVTEMNKRLMDVLSQKNKE